MTTNRGPKNNSTSQTWTGFLDTALFPDQDVRLNTKVGIYADVAVASIQSIEAIGQGEENTQPVAVFQENLEKIRAALDRAIVELVSQPCTDAPDPD